MPLSLFPPGRRGPKALPVAAALAILAPAVALAACSSPTTTGHSAAATSITVGLAEAPDALDPTTG